jgi:hypothetical protein
LAHILLPAHTVPTPPFFKKFRPWHFGTRGEGINLILPNAQN